MTAQASSFDWKAILAFVSLFFSLFAFGLTLYFQRYKRAKVSLVTGDLFTLGYDDRGHLKFSRSICFFNDGAKHAAIVGIRGSISNKQIIELTANTRWHSFVKSENIGEKGKQFKPHWGFNGWPSIILLGSYAAESENITFITDKPFMLVPGDYDVSYRIFGRNGLIGEHAEKITLTEENCVFLDAKCRPMNGEIRKHSLSLGRELN